ncbi:neurofilament medium polypeptide-like isoform X2 [Phlebotomus papatasi]|uniref:neurofilament medium polypeptide-like isoform X2 n=1 Tax=Phlebotomus papatasi TaxID=29031 RepID=UPI0024839A95|nr:neurofilament medium polypeptide-like isoform X2 [Phlebotomus papatasi]
MEVSEVPQGGSSVQKSQMAISESSQESSLQKTSTGQVSSSVATSKNVAESVEKSSSVTSSSIQVQKSSVTSAPNVNGDDSNDEEVEEEEIIEEEAEEEADDASSSSTEVIIVRKIVRKKKRPTETIKTPEKLPEKVPEKIPEEEIPKIPEKLEDTKKVPEEESKESPPEVIDTEKKDGADVEKDEDSVEQDGSAEESGEEEESPDDDDDDGKSETERVEAKETAEVEDEPEKTNLPAEIEVKDQLQVTDVPSTNGEIKQDSIKATIHEIINDIDRQITEETVPEPPTTITTTTEKIEVPELPKQEPPKQPEQPAPVPSVPVQPQQRIPESPPKIPPTVTSMANDDARDDKENGPRVVDLQKIFTPASDAEEIQPSRQRKLYASSSFYSPVLHPTVEDQVELARRISHSLSDISNQHSKGQSMYVNRKKRSVKWVHEGEGKGLVKMYSSSVSHEETTRHESYTHQDKLPLKLVMNPRGQVQDLETLRKQGILIDPTPQSPDRCAEVVNALQATGGKGAELFAKRRKKSEKWVVDETSRASQPTTPMTNMAPVTPAFTDLGVQRAQQTIKLNQIQEKYAQPRVKIVKSPWQTALESGGNVEGAFHEPTVPPRSLPTSPKILPQQRSPPSPAQITRDLAYRPSVPQGWNAPRPHLPLGIYTPPELPLNSYAPPPRVDLPPPQEPPAPIRRPQPPPVVPSAIQRAPQSPIYAPQRPKATPVIQMAPQPMPQPTPQPIHGAPVGKWRNYNTAARGWRGADIYRPVTFDQITPQLPFTDF